MKQIWDIYKKDLHSIVSQIMTVIVIAGLIFLPSLYAWLNIKASWDPYAKTDQIPIGFVNEDAGAVIQGEDVHVGNDLEEQLSEDTNFSWDFIDRETGMEGVKYGDYYATIIVPEDFSETLGSVITTKPEKAEMEYYVNEKINAIAPKITDKGASVIVEEISSQFIATVNGIIFEMFNDIGLELEDSLPDIELFEGYVFTLEEQLPLIHDKLLEMDGQLTEAERYVAEVEAYIPEAKRLLASGKEAVKETNDFLVRIESEVKKLSPKIIEEIETVDEAIESFEKEKTSLDKQLEEVVADVDIGSLGENLAETNNKLAEIEKELTEISGQLEEPNEEIDVFVEQLQEMQEELSKVQNNVASLESFYKENKQFYEELQGNVAAFANYDLSTVVKDTTKTAEAEMLNKIKEAKGTVADAEEHLNNAENKLPEIEAMIAKIQGKVGEGQKVMDTLLNKYPVANEQVTELANKIRKIQSEADLKVIIDLLLNDPEAERSFFKEPVVLHKNEVFPIENYGTGMTPFYTVLSLWVGGLLLISLLSTRIPGQDSMSPKVVYSGRLLIFVTIGLLQTLIVTLGDIFIIGVSVSHKFWFVIFGLLISFVFMTIVYTAVSVLGDVGKALAIILLVLQIASSGGTYPVVLLPEFFQMVHPILPFTYGVDLMREAVGGIIWKRALTDIIALIIFALITLSIGLFFKGPIQKRLSKLMESKTGRLF